MSTPDINVTDIIIIMIMAEVGDFSCGWLPEMKDVQIVYNFINLNEN